MFASLTTKLAMKKIGLSSNAFDISFKPSKSSPADGSVPGPDEMDENNSNWPTWFSTKKLPLTAQAWLSPIPPPVPVAEPPEPGDLAPLDRDRQLEFGGGQPVIVMFLRCAGCAFAQKSFLACRTLANKNQGRLRCIAVSHSSAAATKKWLDLLGGAWNVEIVIDEDRAIYAAWGLGLGNMWSIFNPTTQVQGWKEKGWSGIKVANAIQKTGNANPTSGPRRTASGVNASNGTRGAGEVESEGPSTVMGNKWQQAGLFAVDARGTVVWSSKALRADDVMDLEAAAAILGF